MRTVRSQRVTSMLVVVIAMIGLAGCSPGADGDGNDPTPGPSPPPGTTSFDADGNGFMTADELRSAVNATMPEFPFPPRFKGTGDQIADQFLTFGGSNDPAAQNYQRGLEYTLIGPNHQCAWERVYLQANASGDATLQQESLDALLATLPKYPMDENAKEMFEDYYRKAQLGDPRMVASDVELNCNGIGLLTPAPGTP